jgi:hypothetical protein
MTSTTWNSLSVPLLLAATLYEAIHDRTHKLYNIGSAARCIFKFIFRYQYLVEIYSVSAEKIISDAFSYSENV